MHLLRKFKYHLMLIITIVTWGLDPVINRYLYEYYSAAALAALATFVSAIVFASLAYKKRHLWSKKYLRIALPICLANSFACLLQRIGLQYTTPARYAFLEHLSCITVPLILFLFFRQKPRISQALASVLCLIGCLLLTGAGKGAFAFAIGDILCALAGLLLGLGIVLTAIRARELDITLFMTVHMCTYFFTSLGMMLSLHFIKIDGVPMEAIKFSFSPLPLLAAVLLSLLSIGLCWMLRNEATQHLSPTLVAVLVPFSAVITAAVSILCGIDTASPSFFVASVLILLSAILAGLGDQPKRKSTSE